MCNVEIDEGKRNKEKVLVYGLGNFYLQYEKEICDKYEILAFIDNNKKVDSWRDKIKVIHVNQISAYKYDKLIIMVYNIQECINIINELLAIYNVDYGKIILGHDSYGKFSIALDSIKVTPDGKLQICVDGISVKVASLDEFNNVWEVLVDKVYSYFINNQKNDVILDVGMNIGDATLFFLADPKVEKVYAYEPFKSTFMAAQENLKEYLNDTSGRLEIFQYGISDRNDKRHIGFNKGMTCGQSTIDRIRDSVFGVYHDKGLVKVEDEQIEDIEVKDAVEIFVPILKKYSHKNIILKMDCEGEEYEIIKKLSDHNLLPQFDFIMLEWHYRGKEKIIEYLKDSGFSYWCNDINSDMGSIYAYHMAQSEEQYEIF